MVLGRKNWLPKGSFEKINRLILYVTLPAITLAKISQMHLGWQHIIPAATIWSMLLLAGVFFAILGYFFHWDKKTWAALTLGCGFANTSFVGFPVTEILYGQEGLKYAILVDQTGSFAALCTLGIIVASYGSGVKISFGKMLLRLVKFPAFTCFFIALFVPAQRFHLQLLSHLQLIDIFDFIGSWTNPLAFLSIGMQFTFSFKEVDMKQFGFGLLYKLALIPLFFFILFKTVHLNGLLYDVTILELAMPPMITSSIIATEYGLSPKLSSALINYGMPISILTLTAWAFLI